MNASRTWFSLSFGFFLLAKGTAPAQPAPAEETLGEYMARAPVSAMAQAVSYCATEAPELRAELEQEFGLFVAKVREAMAPLVLRLSDDPGFVAPVPAEVRTDFDHINEMMLAEVKKLDPAVYCPRVLANIRGATVKGLREMIESNIARYEEAARERTE